MRDRIAAVISLAVVLPLLPPTATIGIENSARHACANCCSARSASATTICGSAPRHRPIDDGADGAARRGGGDEFRAVEFRPAQRDEQRARLERAAVGRHRAVRTVLALERSARHARRFTQRSRHPPSSRPRDHAAAPKYRSASRRSLKLRRVAP